MPSDGEKSRKSEKPKRKWKSSTCRGGKLCSSGSVGKDPASQLKNAKRTKVESSSRGKEVLFSDDVESKPVVVEEIGLAMPIKCEQGDLHEVKCEATSDNSFNPFDSIDNELGNVLSHGLGMYFENIEKVEDGSSESEDKSKEAHKMNEEAVLNAFASINGDQTDKKTVDKIMISNNPIVKKQTNGLDCNKNPLGQKPRRNNSFSKSQKNFKKSYVPIQPKPYTPKLNVRFDFGQFPVLEPKKDSEGVSLCEESDSQEPEEEIVRYFQHLEENQIVGNDVFVGQAVKNIENSLVQINGISQDFSNSNNIVLNDNEMSFQSNRSQSCFDCRTFNPREDSARSQSSYDFKSDKKEKLSHLRILLEKSMAVSGEAASSSTNEIKTPCNSNPVGSNIVNQTGGDFANGMMKMVHRGHVPQSPNTRTKYFSFTPISPGPQSPLKTPSTPSASPFVSPRNTPVPRSRQNSSQNDHFLPPSERSPKILNRPAPAQPIDSGFDEAVQNCRPRSFSSTNFYRSKARRNLSKMLSYDGTTTAPTSNAVFQPPNQLPGLNVIANDSLANEVRRFLENNSKEGQIPSFRSQSVPLSRMMGESSWLSNQVSPVYNQYFNFNPTPTPVPSEFSDFDCPKDVTNQSFIPNGEISNLSQVYPAEAQNIPLNDQLFANGFPLNEFTNKLDLNTGSNFDNAFANSDSVIPELKSFLPSFENPEEKTETAGGEAQDERKMFKTALYDRNNENLKDPVITSFKPVLMAEFCNSPGLGLFGSKIPEDNQLIEFLDLEN